MQRTGVRISLWVRVRRWSRLHFFFFIYSLKLHLVGRIQLLKRVKILQNFKQQLCLWNFWFFKKELKKETDNSDHVYIDFYCLNIILFIIFQTQAVYLLSKRSEKRLESRFFKNNSGLTGSSTPRATQMRNREHCWALSWAGSWARSCALSWASFPGWLQNSQHMRTDY